MVEILPHNAFFHGPFQHQIKIDDLIFRDGKFRDPESLRC